MQGKRLRLRVDAVDAVFGHDAVVVPDVEADDRVIDAVARTDASGTSVSSALAKVGIGLDS